MSLAAHAGGSSISLTSLALLKSRIDAKQGDVFTFFEPLILELLFDAELGEVSDSDVAVAFEKKYQLRIPTKSIHHILRRLAKQGQLVRAHGKFFLSEKAQRPARIVDDMNDAEANTRAVIDAFLTFCRDELDRNVSRKSAVKSILAFLDKFSVDCLRAYVFKSTLPSFGSSSRKEEYAVGKFIQHAFDHDEPLFERVVMLVECQMCSNALLCPDLQALDKNFKDVKFYLDAPLLLNLMGAHGEQERNTTDELMRLLKQLSGTVKTFTHNVVEAKNILNSAKRSIYTPGYSTRVLRAARQQGFEETDLELLASSIEDKVSSLGVQIMETPAYVEDFQISEVDLEGHLKYRVRQYSEQARLNDVNSVRAIFVLRHGKTPVRLESAGHVFVTDNSDFARAAWDYSKSHTSFREVSPVVADYSLVNIAWLKAPMKLPSIPRTETLALCYAAVTPTADFAKTMVEKIDQLEAQGLVTPAAHAAMRSSRAYEDELMQLTLGDVEELKKETVLEALRRHEEELTIHHVKAISSEKHEHRRTKHALEASESEIEKLKEKSARWAGRLSTAVVTFTGLLLSGVAVFGTRGQIRDAGGLGKVAWLIGAALAVVSIFVILRRFHKPLKNRLFGLLTK